MLNELVFSLFSCCSACRSLYNVSDFPPSNILWSALPGQAGKLLALYFVVAFGSSMGEWDSP